MVISPSPSHAFRVSVVRNDIAVFSELVVADRAFAPLLSDFAIQQLPHLSWRPEFPVSPGVMWIFDALDTEPRLPFLLRLLTSATKQRVVDRAVFIPSEFHGNAPV